MEFAQFISTWILKIKVVASDIAFKSIILYSNICSKAADWAHYSQLYSGLYPGWSNLSVTHMDHIHIRKYMFFFFFLWILPDLDFRQSHVPFSLTFGQVSAPHVVLRDPGTPVTWTGHGLARVIPGAGLRFAVNNIPFPMDFTMALHYETQVPFKSNVFGGEKLKCILELSLLSSLTR